MTSKHNFTMESFGAVSSPKNTPILRNVPTEPTETMTDDIVGDRMKFE